MVDKFTNIATVIGDVKEKKWNSNIGDGKKLGNLTVQANDDRIYVDLFNPNKAEKNVVQTFFNKLNKDTKIKITGNMQEREGDNYYRRSISPFISAKKGVISYDLLPSDSEVKQKATLALDGDVLDKNLRYEKLDRFDGQNTAIAEIKVAYFNTYNRNGDEDLERIDVLKDAIKNYHDYQKENNEHADLESIERLGNKLKDDDSVQNILEVLDEFYEKYQPRMWNIDILHLVAYNIATDGEEGSAEEISQSINKYDNCRFGCIISNKMIEDEFGFMGDSINELEVKKFEINESHSEEVPFGDGDDDGGWDFD